MSRAYGYGLMNQKLNTLQSLVLTPTPTPTPTLQEVLDAGNTANDKTIQLTSAGGIESNHSSTGINFVDASNNAITNLNNTALTSFDATTGRTYALDSESLIMGGVAGANYTTMSNGQLNMTAIDGSYVALTPFMLNFNGSQGSESQVLTKDAITNLPTWADLPVSAIPDLGEVLNAGAIANQAIDMSGNNIDNVGNITALTETNLQGQFTFNTPPHIPDPILGNDAAPKGYVDSLVGQYAGGFNLFFNYSQTDASYVTFKSLSQLVSPSAGEIVPTTINTGNNLIAQFITEPLGIETIPVGLWDAFVYGAINAIGGDAHYYFELWKKTALNVDSLLGTSGISPDINASPNNNPTSYSMILPISTAIPLALTDRLYVVLYVNYNGATSRSLSTYFEGSYYSFLQTSLNAGTTLLSSNNTWTGTNNFLLPPTTPNQVGTPANTDIVNYGTITDLIEPVVTIINYYISQTNPIFQYPPQPPSSTIINTYGYYGWQFINAVALRKIDWFFAPDYDMEVQDVLGLYMNYFNVASTSNDDLPFISIYTKPLGSGDIIPGFAHSSMTYIANFTPVVNSPYSSFMNITGVQPTPFAYGHQQVGMIQSPVAPNPNGTYTPTMKVLAFSVGTNSTSAVNSVNFVMSKVGVCVAGLNNESVLNPFDANQVGSWVSTATSNLNMSSFSIDASANNLSIGTLTSTGLTLGKATNTTNIEGNLQIAGQSGASGQVLTSNGAGSVPTWTTSTSGWVGTATSDLNMSNYIITGTTSLNLGEVSKSVVINGAVNTPNALNYGSGANVVVAYGGEANNLYDTTTTNNIETRIAATGGLREQVYNAIISPSASGTGALILPLVKTRYSVYIINGSAYNWTIASQTGELIIGGLAGAGIPSTSSVTIKPSQTLGFVQVDGGILGKFNIFMSEVLQGTSPSFSGATCPTIDTTSTLNLGTSTATGVNLGRTGQNTDLLGNVRVNSSSGSSGQVLTSTGASTAPTWQTPSGGSASLAVVKTNPSLQTVAYGAGAFKSTYNNNFLNVTVPTLTATYLIKAQLLCNNNVANTAWFGNLGYRVGGGAQTTSAISLFNNLAFSNAANSSFSQQNSLTQCNLSVDNTYNQLSFTYIHTPATTGLVSYAFWLGSSIGNGAGTVFSMEIIQIIS
jgi:hypothetical protein